PRSPYRRHQFAVLGLDHTLPSAPFALGGGEETVSLAALACQPWRERESDLPAAWDQSSHLLPLAAPRRASGAGRSGGSLASPQALSSSHLDGSGSGGGVAGAGGASE